MIKQSQGNTDQSKGVSTRRMEKLAASLGIESLSASQVSEMTKGLNEQVEQFRNRNLSEQEYPFLWVDALYEKIRQDGHVVSMAVLVFSWWCLMLMQACEKQLKSASHLLGGSGAKFILCAI